MLDNGIIQKEIMKCISKLDEETKQELLSQMISNFLNALLNEISFRLLNDIHKETDFDFVINDGKIHIDKSIFEECSIESLVKYMKQIILQFES